MEKEKNIIEDVSTLTTIPQKALDSLLDKMVFCIVDAVKEDNLDNNTMSYLDLGSLGKLNILHDENQLKYKFIPSEKLNKAMIDLIHSGLNSLESNLENSLVNKITYVYKNLF